MKYRMLLALLALFSLGANAAIINLQATIDGVQEVPQVNVQGTGTQAVAGGSGNAVLTFDTLTNVLAFTIDYSLNTGVSTVAHFHGRRVLGPAGPGISSPTQLDIVGIPGTSSGPVSGTFDFDTDAFLGPAPGSIVGGIQQLTRAERIADLLDGLWYINIHTAVFPGGEIRGQVLERLVVPEPASFALLGLGLIGLAAMRRKLS